MDQIAKNLIGTALISCVMVCAYLLAGHVITILKHWYLKKTINQQLTKNCFIFITIIIFFSILLKINPELLQFDLSSKKDWGGSVIK